MVWLLVPDRDFHAHRFTQNDMKNKQKTASEQEFSGQKHLADERDHRRTDRLARTHRKSTVIQINSLETMKQKSISDRITSNIEVDELQQHKTSKGSTTGSQGQEFDAKLTLN